MHSEAGGLGFINWFLSLASSVTCGHTVMMIPRQRALAVCQASAQQVTCSLLFSPPVKLWVGCNYSPCFTHQKADREVKELGQGQIVPSWWSLVWNPKGQALTGTQISGEVTLLFNFLNSPMKCVLSTLYWWGTWRPKNFSGSSMIMPLGSRQYYQIGGLHLQWGKKENACFGLMSLQNAGSNLTNKVFGFCFFFLLMFKLFNRRTS